MRAKSSKQRCPALCLGKNFLKSHFYFAALIAIKCEVAFFLYLNVNIAESIKHAKLKFSNSVEMKLKFNTTKKIKGKCFLKLFRKILRGYVNIAESIKHAKLKFSNSVEMKLKFNTTKKIKGKCFSKLFRKILRGCVLAVSFAFFHKKLKISQLSFEERAIISI